MRLAATGLAATAILLIAPQAWPDAADTASAESSVAIIPGQALAEGMLAYSKGEWERAIQRLGQVLYPRVQVLLEDEKRAHKLRALSYFQLRDVVRAEDEFKTMLQLDDDAHLDPEDFKRRDDFKLADDFLKEVRMRKEERLEATRETQRRGEAEDEVKRLKKRLEKEQAALLAMKPETIVRTVEKHHIGFAFLPFGVGQFQNGERGKGWALLVTEAALGAASIASFATLLYRPTSTPALSYLPVMFGGAFWIEAAAGIIDALVRYQPEVVVQTSPASPTPPGVSPAKATPKVSAAPFAAPGGGGLTVQGVF